MRTAITGTLILAVMLCLVAAEHKPVEKRFDWPRTLGEWGLFAGALADMTPGVGVVPYEVNSALFSDYANKARFIRMPQGEQMSVNDNGSIDMPEGTVLVKAYYYPNDFRKPGKGRRLMETRLMVHESGEWFGAAYIWNEEQTDATLSIAGDVLPVSWKDSKGKKQSLDYLVPNMNQCQNCHTRSGVMRPIGAHYNQLAIDDQLESWGNADLLTGLDKVAIDPLVDYADASLDLDRRARSYLHANCAHCHSLEGPANSSGLYLNADERDLHKVGVMKAPIAAGRGSAGMQYNIVPGKPNASILLHRMQADDPGIRMPEINRQLEHVEGVKLIREWISSLN